MRTGKKIRGCHLSVLPPTKRHVVAGGTQKQVQNRHKGSSYPLPSAGTRHPPTYHKTCQGTRTKGAQVRGNDVQVRGNDVQVREKGVQYRRELFWGPLIWDLKNGSPNFSTNKLRSLRDRPVWLRSYFGDAQKWVSQLFCAQFEILFAFPIFNPLCVYLNLTTL